MQLSQQQKTLRTIQEQEQLLKDQEELVQLLKEQIRGLRAARSIEQLPEHMENKLMRSSEEIKTLKVELHNMRENNDSLIQTFQAYKQVLSDNEIGQLWKNPPERKEEKVWDSKDNRLSENLRARIKLHEGQDSDPKTSCQAIELGQPSPYAQLYQADFNDNINNRFWETEILEVYKDHPNNRNKVRAKLKSIVSKRTFPQQYRHLFWKWLVDDSLALNQRLFHIILERIATSNEPKLNIITMDLNRLNVLLDTENSQKMVADIESCLYAFIHLRPDVGYVQGMIYFLQMLMVRMSKYEAFRMFCTLIIKDGLMYSLMTFNQHKIKTVLNFFLDNLKQKRPKTYKHFEELGINPDIYLVEWAYTFYSRAFSLSLASKIWDLWLCEGSTIFFKTALSIFELFETQLVELDYEHSLHFIKTYCQKVNEQELIKTIRKQKLINESSLQL